MLQWSDIVLFSYSLGDTEVLGDFSVTAKWNNIDVKQPTPTTINIICLNFQASPGPTCCKHYILKCIVYLKL